MLSAHYMLDVADRELVLKRVTSGTTKLVPPVPSRMALVLQAHVNNGHAAPIKL